MVVNVHLRTDQNCSQKRQKLPNMIFKGGCGGVLWALARDNFKPQPWQGGQRGFENIQIIWHRLLHHHTDGKAGSCHRDQAGQAVTRPGIL